MRIHVSVPRPDVAAIALLATLTVLGGCAHSPVHRTELQPAPSPFAQRSGLVIGTLSYQYADAGRGQPAQPWLVHFERIDAGATRQGYALVVSMDPETQSGIFSGVLPAGVYTFREAESAQRRYAAGAFRMPFEVQAGAVQDAGHYAVSPIQASAMRASWNRQ